MKLRGACFGIGTKKAKADYPKPWGNQRGGKEKERCVSASWKRTLKTGG